MRGQLTLLIIVGILIAIMVGIVLYAARSTSAKKGESNINTQQQTSELLKPVEEFTRQCLDLAARTSLNQLGAQAGTLYESQGGLTPDPYSSTDYVLHNSVKVPFAILPPQGDVGTLFFADTPKYPWETFPAIYENGTVLIAEYLQGYYGINTLPQLIGLNSVQDQLENAVLVATTTCLDWTIFEPQGITVIPQTPHLRVIFGERSTSFLLSYPLDVTSTVTGTTSHIDAFAVDIPVRTKSIMQAARATIDKDVNDITFDPSSVLYGTIGISTSRELFDDILTVTDPSSTVGGKPYLFQFARKNRAPAILWIQNATDKVCDSGTVHASTSVLFVDATGCGTGFDSTTLSVRAYDPDEDAVTFSFQIRTEPVMPSATYTVTTADASFTILPVTARATDGQYTDEQTIIIPTDYKTT